MLAGKAVVRIAEKYGKTPASVLLRYQTKNSVGVIPSQYTKTESKKISIFLIFRLPKKKSKNSPRATKTSP